MVVKIGSCLISVKFVYGRLGRLSLMPGHHPDKGPEHKKQDQDVVMRLSWCVKCSLLGNAVIVRSDRAVRASEVDDGTSRIGNVGNCESQTSPGQQKS